VLTRYGLERFLHRLASSPHADEFVLKGAMLFAVWTVEMHRVTRDVDLLGRGEPDAGRITKLFAGGCRARVVDDGLGFDEDSVRAERIREDLWVTLRRLWSDGDARRVRPLLVRQG
jgi:hypothetical protein